VGGLSEGSSRGCRACQWRRMVGAEGRRPVKERLLVACCNVTLVRLTAGLVRRCEPPQRHTAHGPCRRIRGAPGSQRRRPHAEARGASRQTGGGLSAAGCRQASPHVDRGRAEGAGDRAAPSSRALARRGTAPRWRRRRGEAETGRLGGGGCLPRLPLKVLRDLMPAGLDRSVEGGPALSLRQWEGRNAMLSGAGHRAAQAQGLPTARRSEAGTAQDPEPNAVGTAGRCLARGATGPERQSPHH